MQPTPFLQNTAPFLSDMTPDPLHSKSPAPAAKVGTVPRLITAQTQQNADRLALQAGAESLSYGDLEKRANQLANYLASRGAKADSVIGLCLERSIDFVVAALAVMKCGAAYLPMDPAHPAQRLRFVADDSGAMFVLTRTAWAEHFPSALVLENERAAIAGAPEQAPNVSLGEEQLAYVIYTSGSTGQPKGVEVTHGNLSHLVAWHQRAFRVNAETRATFQAGVGFDAAVWEIWPHLAAGASVHLPDETTRVSAEMLRDWLVAQEISISFAPTAIAEQLLALPWPAETSLQFLLTGADTLHRRPPRGLPFAFINNYGPTECTVVATSGEVSAEGDGSPAIGRPIDGTYARLLDSQRREVSDGETGELYLGGAGVARGYRNRPELTAERFIADPRERNARLYRTGDLARRLANGEIVFLARVDDQVKIRGNRIELGEINAALHAQPSVQSGVVIAREDEPGEKRLVAYVVAAGRAQPNEQLLREALRERLPDYMEPSAFVWLDSLPLTANGKIDRKALPVPKAADSPNEQFVAPRNEFEETLAGIIAEVLKLPRVSVQDDFFHLGAHSLLGAQIIAKVRGVFGTELKLLDVFDSPTVEKLAIKIEEALTRQLSAMSEEEVAAALAAPREDADNSAR